MITDIQDTMKKLEDEINDLIKFGEAGEKSLAVKLHCCPDGMCNCIKYPDGALKPRKLKSCEPKNVTRKPASQRSKSFNKTCSKDFCGIEKTFSWPCPGGKKPSPVKLTKSNSKKCQSKTMANKASSMDNAPPIRALLRKRSTSLNSTFKSESEKDLSNKEQSNTHRLKSIPPLEFSTTNKTEIDLLKDELQKVKSQISILKSCPSAQAKTAIDELITQVTGLKRENKALNEALNRKKQEFEITLRKLNKVQDLLTVYAEKVSLLHEKAIDSSRVMNESRDKFCKCLQEKDEKIKKLMETTKSLKKQVRQKEDEIQDMSSKLLEDPTSELTVLKDTNEIYCDCIKKLESKLHQSTLDCENFKKQISECNERLEEMDKLLSEKCTCAEQFGSKIVEMQNTEADLREEVEKLTKCLCDKELENSNQQFMADHEIMSLKLQYEDLNNQYTDLMEKYEEYEKRSKQCEMLEKECQCNTETTQEQESVYLKEREVLRSLVDQLTSVVEQNKHTLMHLSQVNQEQEQRLTNQDKTLTEKEQYIKQVEGQYGILKKKSEELEKEMEFLVDKLSDDGKRITCADMRQRVIELMDSLNRESDAVKSKDGVIQEQQRVIENLQNKLEEHTKEIRKSKEEVNHSLAEVLELNMVIKEKEVILVKESREKRSLMEKLRNLEAQKNTLVDQMSDLEDWIKECFRNSSHTQVDQEDLTELQEQIEHLRALWMKEKAVLCEEKEKATSAARFATQKLIETISDFQKQVHAQKKVQHMLSTMLQQKEEQLRLVKAKMSSISALSHARDYLIPEEEEPIHQLYKNFCSTTTNGSFTTCSENTPIATKKGRKRPCTCFPK